MFKNSHHISNTAAIAPLTNTQTESKAVTLFQKQSSFPRRSNPKMCDPP